ncbi:hypothetical protein SUGI_0111750 [Cryptomeria japonica]|uniref:pectinesterase n=1 Tax=Cryptomeria japonica TaxID=3369 RepID=UPI002408A263|nr:pectinesterase [Cryptomeria japonica]GLJ09556.1 hypothetical protein SUGI_0111750 [Cryptomeria japonica]
MEVAKPVILTRRAVLTVVASVTLFATFIRMAVLIAPYNSHHSNIVMKNLVHMALGSNHSIHAACQGSADPQLCASIMASLGAEWPKYDHEEPSVELLKESVLKISAFVEQSTARALALMPKAASGLEQIALADCLDLYNLTLDELGQAFQYLHNFSQNLNNPEHGFEASYAHMFLSAALTNQDTCIEGFANTNGALKSQMQLNAQVNSYILSPCLAMSKKISDLSAQSPAPAPSPASRRALLWGLNDDFPAWLSASDRRLLKDSTGNLQIDAVVAQDGTGDYCTISEAVEDSPQKSEKRYVIYVKAGVYRENVEIEKNKRYLTLIGEGINCTIVTGNRSVADNITTYHTATFAVKAEGFIARDITFENTAGAENNQAVALLVVSHESVFYRCSMKGYQDTLYAHSLCQFYRECEIYGTVDFIFGDAAAVFQKCVIMARKPMIGQQITITAQGRNTADSDTGFSIHDCNVMAAPDLIPVKDSFQTFLGRPFGEYSRTVFMQSYLDDIIQPKGWVPWNASDFALNTLFYGEYKNYGVGASVEARVNWTGYQILEHPSQVKKFTVARLIHGKKWLKPTGVPFIAGLKHDQRD